MDLSCLCRLDDGQSVAVSLEAEDLLQNLLLIVCVLK